MLQTSNTVSIGHLVARHLVAGHLAPKFSRQYTWSPVHLILRKECLDASVAVGCVITAQLFMIVATVPETMVISKDCTKLCHNGFVYDFGKFSSDRSFCLMM